MMIAAVGLSLAIAAGMLLYIGFFAGTIHGGRRARQDLDRGQTLRERVEVPDPAPRRKGPDCKGD
jgi:hypothetical protein